MKSPGWTDKDAVAFDFETWLIAPGLLAPPPVCATFAWCEREQLSPPPPIYADGVHAALEAENTRDILREMYERAGLIFGANTAYDTAVAMEEWPELIQAIFAAYDEDRVRDVQLDQRLIDNAQGRLGGANRYDLAGLEKRWMRIDRSAEKDDPDAWRLRYRELDAVPMDQWPHEAIDYAIGDATGTLSVHAYQRGMGEVLLDSASQARASLSLHLMSCWGVHTDSDNIDAFEQSAKDEYDQIFERLVAEGLMRDNAKQSRDTKAAKARMVEVMWGSGREIVLTDKGVETLGIEKAPPPDDLSAPDYAATVEKYAALGEDVCDETNDEILEMYGQVAALKKTIGTRVPDLRKGVHEPIQGRFQALQATGRTSSSKGKGDSQNGYQMQNLSRTGPERECFVARPGWWFAGSDFDGLELCTMSQVCHNALGFSRLGDAINMGKDPHLMLGARLIGISYEDALRRYRAGDKEVKLARQVAKCGNFGFPGGLGVHTFITYAKSLSGGKIRLSLTESTEVRNAWWDEWSEFDLYFKWIKEQMVNGRAHMTQFYSLRQRGGATFCAAANGYFQGLGADGAKAAAWACTRAAYAQPESPFYGARPWNFVHDEILSEVRQDKAHEQATEMARLMVEACNEYLPDVPTSSTPVLMSHWCKDADAVYDAPPSDGGRLVPWDIAKDNKSRVFNVRDEVMAW